MTKAADKIIDFADNGIAKAMFMAGRHFAKIKKAIKNDDNKWSDDAQVTENIINIGENVAAGTIDFSAAVLLKLSQIFVNGMDGLLFDNKILKTMRQKFESQKIKKNKDGKDNKLSLFTKNNPQVAAYLTWYLMLLTVFGGAGLATNKSKKSNDIQNKTENVKHVFADNSAKRTIDIQKIYNPADASFKKDFINENWSEIITGLLEFETYREKPVKHTKESRSTYGPGLTWVYDKTGQHACVGTYKDMAEQFSEEQIWDQVKQHCLYKGECLSKIKSELKKYNFSVVTDNQIKGLLFAGYQTPSSLGHPIVNKTDKKGNIIKDKNGNPIKERMPGIIPKLSEAGNDIQKIVDSFIAGKDIDERWRDGTNKRRWWCAMCYIGKISVNDLLSMDCDAFSEISLGVVMKNGHFVYDDSTIEYALSRKNTKKKNVGTVQDFIDSRPLLTAMMNGTVIMQQQDGKKTAFNYGVHRVKNMNTKTHSKQYDSNDETRG